MGAKPKLEKLDSFIKTGENFCLTGAQYEELTGAALPKSISYLKNKSAVAEWAREHGYKIADVQEEPIIERTVYFKRK